MNIIYDLEMLVDVSDILGFDKPPCYTGKPSIRHFNAHVILVTQPLGPTTTASKYTHSHHGRLLGESISTHFAARLLALQATQQPRVLLAFASAWHDSTSMGDGDVPAISVTPQWLRLGMI